MTAVGHAFDPRVRVTPTEPSAGERCAYELEIDALAAPQQEQPEVLLGKISTGASFVLEPRRAVRD